MQIRPPDMVVKGEQGWTEGWYFQNVPGDEWDYDSVQQLLLQTFPEHGGKWQVSTGGGDYPVWSRVGRALYFLSADRKMMAVEVKDAGKKFDAGVPKPLFEVRQLAQFGVSKDGRFLIHVPQDQAAGNVPLMVVVNWQAALKK